MRTLVCVLFAACGGSTPPPTSAAPVHVVPAQEEQTAGARTRPVSVEWSGVNATPGCFFFAGPGDHGRDEPLGSSAELTEEPDHVALSFGDAHFLGRAGTPLELQRITQHDYEGKWEITQSMTLTSTSSGWQGTYQYQECQVDIQAPCPGNCSIQANLTIVPLS